MNGGKRMDSSELGPEIAKLRAEVGELRRALAATVPLRVGAGADATGGSGERVRFAEIDVERINVVEPDGTVRVVISNNACFPAPVVQGKAGTRAGGPLAGLILYNGDECGGLYGYGRTAEDGTFAAG